MSTSNITIGVPINKVHLTLEEIKSILINNHVMETYSGRKVNMTIRLPEEVAERLRKGAELNEMTIVDFTASLINFDGSEDAWLTN